MRSRIKDEFRLKNAILKDLFESEKTLAKDVVSIAKNIGSDFNTVHVLVSELEVNGYVEVKKVDNFRTAQNNLWVYKTIKGEVFIKNGGYHSSILYRLLRRMRKKTAPTIADIIIAILIGLTIAFIAYKLGWTESSSSQKLE